MKKTIRITFIVLLFVIFLFAAWKVFGILNTYQKGQSVYDELEQFVSFGNNVETMEPIISPETSLPAESMILEIMTETAPMATPDISAWPVVDFTSLSEINPDIIGWIYIDGTNINYPIVQGSDNDYYLNHLFDGTWNSSGSIFMDVECNANFSDRHSIIYGHHMKNNKMFSALMNYKEPAFYADHSTALIVTKTAYYEVRFFSGYVSDNSANAWQITWNNDGYDQWLKEIQERSCFETDMLPSVDDKIVTLSTCTYEFEDAKFVLHGYIARSIDRTTVE